MVVAVIAMRVMQVILDAIVDVVAVRHRVVAAARPMHMARVMPGAAMVGGAAVGIGARYFDHMLVDMPLMRVVQVAVVQIIDVAVMADRLMAAAGAVLVGMLGMMFVGAGRHRSQPFRARMPAPCPARWVRLSRFATGPHKGEHRGSAARFETVPKVDINDRRSIERIYPPDAFAVDAAENQKQPGNELVRGVRIASPPDGAGAFELDPAALHVGEDPGTMFLAAFRPAGTEARASTHPHDGYDDFIDRIIGAAREFAETAQTSPGPGDPRLRGLRQ